MQLKKTLLSFVFILLLSGCSVFRSITTDREGSAEQLRQNNIIRESFEDISIEIPPEIFARIIGPEINYRPPADTSDSVYSETPERSQPVKITINKRTKTRDRSVVTTSSDWQSTSEETVKKEPKGILGFGRWIFIAGLAVVVVGAWILIKNFF